MNTNDEFEALKNLVKDLTEQGVKVTVRISLNVVEEAPEKHPDYHPDHEQQMADMQETIDHMKTVLADWGLDIPMSVTAELEVKQLLGGRQ